jgi:hypothetical protein
VSRRLLALALAGVCAAASAPAQAQPPRAQSAPPAANAPAAPPGSEFTIYVMTMGQGDQVWEHFGHNAIGVRDTTTGLDVVYNWGMFSFGQEGFLIRFLRGVMTYWMAPMDARQTVAAYAEFNRSVWVQELELTPAQKVDLIQFLDWNAREENKFYRYDYFRDNCSTRVRDALDRVLGGQLKREFGPEPTTQSYRDHAVRLTASDVPISAGIDVGLGLPSDRKITAWEETFIPMKLRDRLRSVRVRDAAGNEVPLVRAERQLFEATRAPERPEPPNRIPAFLAIGLVWGGLIAFFASRAGRTTGARGAAITLTNVWLVLAGLIGLAMVLLWTLTHHVFAYRNMNLFHYHPLWLVVLGALPAARRRSDGGAGRLARALAVGGVAASALGVVLLAIPALRQGTGAPLGLAVPMNLAVAYAVLRLAPRRPAASR